MKNLNKLTTNLYQTISFNRDTQPDFEKLKCHFIEGGRLINNNEDQPQEFTISQFIDVFQQQIENGKLDEFEEKEISSTTEVFGNIAHRFSVYEVRLDVESEKPAFVGINSIQFIKVKGKWLVTSMVWNDQKEGRKIPEKYLESK